jgi:hypothetical protein
MNIDDAKQDLLEDAAKDHKQLLLVKTLESEHVKGHCMPEEVRAAYVEALESLLGEGAVKLVFKNKDLQLYECTASAWRASTIAAATQQIVAELNKSGAVYKIHSQQGEFVQCGDQAIDGLEVERIVFLKALHKLLYSGQIVPVNDSKQFCTFRLAPNFKRERQARVASVPRVEEMMPPHIVPAEETLREAS